MVRTLKTQQKQKHLVVSVEGTIVGGDPTYLASMPFGPRLSPVPHRCIFGIVLRVDVRRRRERMLLEALVVVACGEGCSLAALLSAYVALEAFHPLHCAIGILWVWPVVPMPAIFEQSLPL